jgi:FKBP-type peptidyl-prolyl cis-trans isomerase 2
MSVAQLGDRVRVQYSRIPAPGAALKREPSVKTCEFTVGGREVFPTLSLGVVGMAPGDQKRFTLQPLEGYGTVRPKLVRRIPRARFPEHLVLHVGKRLAAVHGIFGRRRRVTVVKIGPDSVTVDGNHPLAGQVIELDVMLISVDSSADANRSKPQFDMGGES